MSKMSILLFLLFTCYTRNAYLYTLDCCYRLVDNIVFDETQVSDK